MVFLLAAMWLGSKLTYRHGVRVTGNAGHQEGPPGTGDAPAPSHARPLIVPRQLPAVSGDTALTSDNRLACPSLS